MSEKDKIIKTLKKEIEKQKNIIKIYNDLIKVLEPFVAHSSYAMPGKVLKIQEQIDFYNANSDANNLDKIIEDIKNILH
jgi:hypothetical protein